MSAGGFAMWEDAALAPGLVLILDLDVAVHGDGEAAPTFDPDIVRRLVQLKAARTHLVLVSAQSRDVVERMRPLIPGAIWAAESGAWRCDDRGWRAAGEQAPESSTVIEWVRSLYRRPVLIALADERANEPRFADLGDDDIVVAVGPRDLVVVTELLDWLTALRSGRARSAPPA